MKLAIFAALFSCTSAFVSPSVTRKNVAPLSATSFDSEPGAIKPIGT